MSEPDLQAIKERVLGGEEAARRWNVALDALHLYAHASGALAGRDVIAWFDQKTNEYREAMATAGRNQPAKATSEGVG